MGEYTIAKYIRLSLDDAISDSMSIENQRLLLDAHIAGLDIPNVTVIERVDNSCSGVDFERPGIQELLELVRAGRVNCIAVKDFSRFGRNAIETGYFIERVFPLFGVRFISGRTVTIRITT
jgi:DNA invertase Pin-like site-specific DNA recombinase